MATERQKRVAKKITENNRNKKVKNKGKILKECDYSDNISKQPSVVLNSKGVQEELKPFVDEMIAERKRAIEAMKTKNLDKVQYEKLSDVIDKLTKNIQLLSGGATGRVSLLELIDELDEDTDTKTEK